MQVQPLHHFSQHFAASGPPPCPQLLFTIAHSHLKSNFCVTFSLVPLSCTTRLCQASLTFFYQVSNTVLACTSPFTCVELVSMWTTISGNCSVFFRISFAFLVTQIFWKLLYMKDNHTDDSIMTVIFLCHLHSMSFFFPLLFLFLSHYATLSSAGSFTHLVSLFLCLWTTDKP